MMSMLFRLYIRIYVTVKGVMVSIINVDGSLVEEGQELPPPTLPETWQKRNRRYKQVVSKVLNVVELLASLREICPPIFKKSVSRLFMLSLS